MHMWIILAIVPSVCGVATLWLTLRFLWRVYARGGAKDLTAAADVIRLLRPPARWRSDYPVAVKPRSAPPADQPESTA